MSTNTDTTATNPATNAGSGDELLTPAEVAGLFRVNPKTVTRWAKAGKLPALRTLGGHRRYRADHVRALLTIPPVEGGGPR